MNSRQLANIQDKVLNPLVEVVSFVIGLKYGLQDFLLFLEAFIDMLWLEGGSLLNDMDWDDLLEETQVFLFLHLLFVLLALPVVLQLLEFHPLGLGVVIQILDEV